MAYRINFMIFLFAMLSGCSESPLNSRIPRADLDRMDQHDYSVWQIYVSALRDRDLSIINEIANIPADSLEIVEVKLHPPDEPQRIEVTVKNVGSQPFHLFELEGSYVEHTVALGPKATSAAFLNQVAPGETVSQQVHLSPPITGSHSETMVGAPLWLLISSRRIVQWTNDKLQIEGSPTVYVPISETEQGENERH